MSTQTQAYTGTLVVETCCNTDCLVPFGLSREMYEARRKDRRTFYCPNGHGQHYVAESEEQRLRRQLGYANARATAAEDQAQAAEYRRRAAKGQQTRILNLIARGVCPVGGCRRNFTNVREHMATEHPDFHVHEAVTS